MRVKTLLEEMEAFAAMLVHTDDQIGRLLASLEEAGQLDRTLIMVTSDNGASAECGLAGSHNETYVSNGLLTPLDVNMNTTKTGLIDEEKGWP